MDEPGAALRDLDSLLNRRLERRRQQRTVLRLGTVERHALPIQEFLFAAYQGDKTGERGVEIDVKTAPELTAARVEQVLREHPKLKEVHLFYTGLTEVTMVAAAHLASRGLTVVVYRHDREANEHHPYLIWDKGKALEWHAFLGWLWEEKFDTDPLGAIVEWHKGHHFDHDRRRLGWLVKRVKHVFHPRHRLLTTQ